MRWLLRPSTLVTISVALALGAAALVWWTGGADARPEPRPVRDGDREVVFLYPAATCAANWERFVTAATTAIDAAPDDATFPRQTTAVPELAVPLGEGK